MTADPDKSIARFIGRGKFHKILVNIMAHGSMNLLKHVSQSDWNLNHPTLKFTNQIKTIKMKSIGLNWAGTVGSLGWAIGLFRLCIFYAWCFTGSLIFLDFGCSRLPLLLFHEDLKMLNGLEETRKYPLRLVWLENLYLESPQKLTSH